MAAFLDETRFINHQGIPTTWPLLRDRFAERKSVVYQDAGGFTVLSLAATTDNLEAVDLLLKDGADPGLGYAVQLAEARLKSGPTEGCFGQGW